MPDYQDMEYVPDLERIEEETALLEQAKAAQLAEQQELEGETESTPEPTQEKSEGPKDIYGRPWPRPQEEVDAESQQIAEEVVTGVGDTFLGVGEMLEKAVLHGQEGPISALKNKYEETFPTSTPLRKFAGLVLPMVWGGGLAQGALKGSSVVQQLPRWKQIAASTAAEIGVEATVLAGSTSATDDNMIKMFNDTFGTNLIGATSDEYHPSFNYALNVLEGATITSGIAALEVFAFLRSAKLGKPSVEVIANTPEAAEVVARNADVNLDVGANPYDIYKRKRDAALDGEAANRLVKFDGENIADLPYTRDIDGVQRPVQNLNVDKVRAVVDNARIKFDPTVGAGVRPSVLSNEEVRAVVNSNAEEHSDILGEVAAQMFPDVDAVVGDMRISQAQLRAEVDNTVLAAFNSDPAEFADNVNAMKSMLLGTEKFLTPEQFLVLGESFKRTFDLALSPDKLRASGMIAQQAADNISTASVAAALVDEVTDVTPQLVNVFENLRLLSGEVERHKFAKKFGLERIRTLKMVRDPETAQEATERLIQLNKEYSEGVGKAINEGRAITDNLREIAEANPRYLKPFRDLFLEAGNDVNNLYTMNRWLQNKLGVMKKAIIDGNPEVPSLIIQGMKAAMYNSVLLGASLPKSIVGNAILTAAKPISAVLGAGRGAILKNGADAADLRRSIAVYSGVKENFFRGLDLMRRRWKHINENPLLAQKGGRADLRTARSEELDKIESFKEAWLAEGKPFDGRVAAANTAILLGWYNDNKIVRSGVNALHAIDGFFSAFQGTGIARARAYDEIFQYSNGALNGEYFDKRSAELFDSYFDPVSGLPTDEAVKHATAEITLNLPNFLVNRLEGFLDAVPAAQPTFMFARTGMNAFDVSWSFMPTSELGVGIGRARKLLAARTKAEKAAALAEHGFNEYSEAMWLAKKNEYIGRTIAGQGIVMAGTLWALDGNLYGPGPTDAGERQRMMRVMGGNYFNHIKNPFTGEWHDYRGMEPFSMLLGLIGSAVNEAQRTDEAVMEDIYRKTAHAITMNVTNQTFFKQFEPLAALLGKDPTAWSRFAANTANMVVPLSGLRTIVNNTFAPQLKDVERDLGSMVADRMFPILNTLEDEIDIYTGQPINYVNPINAGINAVLPFLKSNGGMESWRQWLVETGWDGGSRIRKNPDTGIEYEPWDRQWIHRYIAQHMKLAGQIQALSENPELNKEMKEYKRQLDAGQFNQAEFPVENTKVYQQLDLIHDRAFKIAHLAWIHKNLQHTRSGALRNQVENQILYGDIKGAAKSAEALRKQNKEVKNLIKMNK